MVVRTDSEYPNAQASGSEVNAFCDEGIAELVSAPSEVPGLVTIESCKGDE